jgi:hypothetical protein
MNGIALGGSHGLFTHPGKAIGNIFSLKNVVPDLTAAAGAAVGAVVGGPVGFAVGAGLGEAAGEKIEGKSWEQSALSGVEVGSLAYGGAELYEAGAGAGAAAGAAAGGGSAGAAASDAATSTWLGSAINAAGADVGITGGTLLGTAVNDIGTGALAEIGSAESALGFGSSAAAPSVGFAGSEVSSPALSTALASTAGDVTPAAGALSGAAGIEGAGAAAETGAAAAAPWYSTGNLVRDAISLAPTAINLLRGNQPVKGEAQVNAAAAQDTAQGNQLQSYLQTGTLPPGAQATINASVAAQQAQIRSQYANMGMTGSSAEAQDLAAAQSEGVAQATNVATSLLQTGIAENEYGTQLYGDILNENLQKDNDLGSAIGNFASAMVPGGAAASPTAGAASSLASANT